MNPVRLNAAIAAAGHCSRRKAADLIKEGQVTVNGARTIAPWTLVTAADRIAVDGVPLKKSALDAKIYVIFNKPAGVTTTLNDRYAARKIIDFIPREYGRVYPVGRLDRESRGLIILTNDGALCNRLTHPRFEVEKEYVVRIRGKADTALVRCLLRGVTDDGDLLRANAAAITYAGVDHSEIRLIVHEGKKRHIRRLLARIGHAVLDLVRVRIGGLRLGNLKEGEFKVVDEKTLQSYLTAKSR